jgi:hypothetical protein
MKKFEILRELPNVTQRHEVSTCCCKNGADRFPRRRVATNLQFVKKKKKKKTTTTTIPAKSNKTMYACSLHRDRCENLKSKKEELSFTLP